MNTPLSSIVLILFSSFIGSFGAVFLKLGAEYMRPGVKGFVPHPAFQQDFSGVSLG